MAGFGTAPQATRSAEYGIASPVEVYARWRAASRDELAGCEHRAGLGRQRPQVEVPHLAELEGHGDSERPVPEMRLRSEKLDGYVVPRERT
jgi:hypothetical protein